MLYHIRKLSIATLFASILLCHANRYYYDKYHIDYKWNPLQFPSTKIYTILTFDDVAFHKITNTTDNEHLTHICDMIKQCWYDAFGYTITTETTPTTPIPTTDLSVSLMNGDTVSSSSSSRRLLSDSESAEEYDTLLKGVINMKNIKKSLLSNNRLNYTFGVLFNDIDIYDEFKSMNIDSIDHNYQLLRAIYHQCLFLTLNIKHIELQIMSISEGMYEDEYNRKHNTNNTSDNETNLAVDLRETLTPQSTETLYTNSDDIQYKVMITVNEVCLMSNPKETNVSVVIDDIISFYGDCLDGDDDNTDKYKTYKVSDIDMVYFFKIVGNDKRCLINIDMEYLENKCVDMIEYEPIYELDTIDCDIFDTNDLHLWNLDFFDGNPDDGYYRILDNHHEDHGVDQYILDTGILSSHEIFTHNNNHNLVYINQLRASGVSGNALNAAPAPTTTFVPSHYHGTYVAGIAGGNTYGTSRNVTIYDYEVCEGSSCTYSKVLSGIEAAKLNMISTGRRGVINLSFGGAISETNYIAREKWDFIMKGIIDAGGIPVCSAGNTQLNGCDYVPAQSRYCISVGAFDVLGDLYSRTNYGECVNIFAPGVSIKSAGTSTTSQYIVRSGTSAAAPHITGLISNLLWINPRLTFDHILYVIDNHKQYLSSCPNNYTDGTQCPYISLSCSSFEEAIDTAILHVPVDLFPTNAPTEHPVIIIRDETTFRPTPNPTERPTTSTTIKPTETPTLKPTEIPTSLPTVPPTFIPTDAPVAPTTTTTLSPSTTPTNTQTVVPTETYQGLELCGFNNGFTVDFGKIINDDDSSNLLYHNDMHTDIHNDAHFVSCTYISLILRFSHVLFVLYLI